MRAEQLSNRKFETVTGDILDHATLATAIVDFSSDAICITGRRWAFGKLRVFGNDYDTPDGTGVRDYIHVVDLAKAHAAAIRFAEGHRGCEVFNIGTGQHLYWKSR